MASSSVTFMPGWVKIDWTVQKLKLKDRRKMTWQSHEHTFALRDETWIPGSQLILCVCITKTNQWIPFWKNRCLLCESYKTHKYTVRHSVAFSMFKVVVQIVSTLYGLFQNGCVLITCAVMLRFSWNYSNHKWSTPLLPWKRDFKTFFQKLNQTFKLHPWEAK